MGGTIYYAWWLGYFCGEGLYIKNHVNNNDSEEYFLPVIRSDAIQVCCAVYKPCDMVTDHGAKYVNTKKGHPQRFAPQEARYRNGDYIDRTVEQIVVPVKWLKL
jgi:hypothetical protein